MGRVASTLPAWSWAACLAATLQMAAAQTSATWNGSNGLWTDGTRWSTNPTYPLNGQPAGGDSYAVWIASGNVNRNVAVTVAAVNLSGGVVYGTSALTVTGAMNWSGGVVEDGDLLCNGGLTITGNARLYGASAEMILAGAQTASLAGAGTLALESQAKVTNHGTFYARNDAAISEVGPNQSAFANAGTFTRDTATGTFTVGATQFSNSGTLNVSSGTLDFLHGITNSGAIQIAVGATLKVSGASIFNAGSSFSGTGQWLVENDEQHMHLSLAVPNSVTLETAGKISIYDGHTLTLNGTLDWAGGNLTRESSFFGGDHGYVTLNGGATIGNGSRFSGLTVTNAAASTAVLAANAQMWFQGDSVFENAGIFVMQNSTKMNNDTVITGNMEFHNTGVLTANADGLNPVDISVNLVNAGTVNVAAGTLRMANGSSSNGIFQAAGGATMMWLEGLDYAFGTGTSFTGAGTFSLYSGNQSIAASLATSGNFAITSSLAIAAGKSFTHNGTLAFSGILAGGGSLLANNGLTLNGGTIDASTLVNSATSAATQTDGWFGTTYTLTNGGVFSNAGTFVAQGDGGFAAGSGSGNKVVNSGSFTRTTSGGTYEVHVLLENSGTVSAQSGTLRLSGGGTSTGGTFDAGGGLLQFAGSHVFDGATTFTGAGTAEFMGGTSTVSGPLNAACTIALSGAVLAVQTGQTVTATGPLVFGNESAAGNLTGGGTFQANGGITLYGGYVNAATLANATGQTAVHASPFGIVLQNGGVINNAGAFLAQADASIYQDAALTSVMNNSGSLTRNTGAGVYTIAVPLNNTGTVSAQSGTLRLSGGGTSNDGTFDANGGLLQFAGDFVFDGTSTFTGTSTAEFASGTSTVNGPLNAACTIALTGGTLAVPGGQTVTAAGPLILGGALPSNLTGGGTLLASGGITLNGTTLNGTTLTNAAGQTATHGSATGILLDNGGVFINAGTYLAQSDTGIAGGIMGSNLFRNTGTFTRNVGIEYYNIGVPFENTGTVNTETGYLALTQPVTTVGGSFHTAVGAVLTIFADASFDSAALFTGGGSVQFGSGNQTFVQSTVSGSVLSLTGGAMVLPPGVSFTSNGFFHWDGGVISGAGSLNANAGLDITNSVHLTDSALTVAAGQTAAQTGAGQLTLDGNAIFTNAGTYRAANDAGIGAGSGAGFAFNNPGTFVRDTGVGGFTVAVPFHNGGSVDVQSGALTLSGGGSSSGIYQVAADLDLTVAGTTHYTGDSAFAGPGRINLTAGTQAVDDSMASSAIVNLSGGILSIAPGQTFTNSGDFHWSGGTTTGGGTLDNTGNFNLTGASVVLDGTTFHTSAIGVSSFEGLGSVVLNNAAAVHNEGNFFLLNDGAIGTGDATAVSFENSGTVTRATGTGVFSINIPFNHSGTINLNSGSLALNGGGTAANSSFHTQAGTALYVGTNYTFGANNVMTGDGATHFSNGSLHVTGSLATDGSFNWTGGTLDGGGLFQVKGGLVIAPGSGGVFISGTTLENALGSEAVISGASATHISGGGTYRNAGITRLQGTNNFSDDGGGSNSIVNSGTLIRDGGTGNYTVTLPVHNTGTIRSSSGALLLNAGGSASAGALDANGGDIYLNGGAYEFTGGTITGSSFVYLTAGTAQVTADTGATSGPATGGFGIAGGTFGGTAMLSVERGYFSTGSMTGTAVLRLTGESSKISNTYFTMSGGTIQNDGSFSQGAEANWDLDNSDVAGGGTISNNGTWTMNGSSSFSNTYGGGSFDNAGTFHQAVGYSWMRPAFHNRATGVLNSTAGYILLAGGGSQAAGSILNAAGGDIYFYGGTHELNGGTLTGSNFTYASLGTVNINGNVGATSGPATGGFGLVGSTIGGTAMISADRGFFRSGQINGTVVVRTTGDSIKENNSYLSMAGGTIQNDGYFTQGSSANYDLDNSETVGGGTLQNNGTWSLTNGSYFSNTYGGGVFNNPGTINQSGGDNYIYVPVHNAPTGVLNATAGAMHLMAGGTQAAGSVLNANGGNIYFRGGTQELDGGSIIGNDYAYAMNGTVNINHDINATSGPATGGFAVYNYGGNAYVGGTAMLSVDHGYLASGTITGSPVLRFTGDSSKGDNTYLSMTGGTIRNEGTFTQGLSASYDLDVSDTPGGGTLLNIGTWNLTNTSNFSNTYGGGTIINPGTFNFLGGSNNFYAGFHNQATGIVNASAGNVCFVGNSTHAAGSVLNADAAGAIVFQSGTHQLDGTTLTGNGWAYVYSGTVDITADVNPTSGPATGGFAVYSYGGNAYVSGTAMLSVERGYLASGFVSGDVVLRMTGESSKGDYTYLSMTGGTIRNEGTFTQANQANYDLDGSDATGGGTLVNTGTWTLTNSSNFSNTYGGGVFTNSGTLNQAGGSNTIHAAFNNQAAGVLNATAGSIFLSGGGEQATGSVLNADGGYIYLNGGAFTLNTATISGSTSVYASGGTVNINENIGATSGPAQGGFGISGYYVTVTGTGMLSAERGALGYGNISGSPVLRFTGVSSKASSSHLNMSGGTIQNDGTFTQGYQANYELDSSNEAGGGTLQNNGTWNLTEGSQFSNSYGGGVFNNPGTLNQSGGENYMYAMFHNAASGVVNATSGALHLMGGSTQAVGSILNAVGGTIYFQGGTHEWNGGSITGSTAVYAIGGTVIINGNVNPTSGPATGGFGISGYYVTVAGTGMLSAERGDLGYGNISGSPVLRFTGASGKASSSHLTMSGGTIQNDGTFTQGYQANYELDSSNEAGGGMLQNNGTWNLTDGSQFSNTYGGGVFNNPGTFNQSGGANYMYALFHNAASGVVNSTSGTLRLLGGSTQAVGSVLNANGGSIYFQGGTHEWNGGSITGSTSVYAISGTVNINGNVNPASGAATGGFGISGSYATVAGTGMLSAERGDLGYGSISGSPVLRFTGASGKASYSHLTMSGGTIQNDGTFTQGYQANYELDSSSEAGGGTLQNNGTWNLTDGSQFSNTNGGGVFNNPGTLNQSGGDNYIYAAVSNSGTLHATGGTLYLYGGSTHTGALVTDSHIVLGAGTHSMTGSSARLGGAGALSGNLTISDGASIATGNSPGTLTLYGHVEFVAGGTHPACAVELAGAASFDQIAIAGGATLGLGSDLTELQVTLQYAPTFGDSFRIVNASGSGHYTGTFRNVPATDSVLTVSYGAQVYNLGVTYDAAGKYVDLTVLTPYSSWAYGKGLRGEDAAFGADPDFDGIPNGIEFVIGGEPNPANPGSNSTDLLPKITVDQNYLRVIYRRHDAAAYLAPGVEFNGDLTGAWTLAEQGVNGVIIAVTDDGFGASIDLVEVLIPRSNAVAGKLFARVKMPPIPASHP